MQFAPSTILCAKQFCKEGRARNCTQEKKVLQVNCHQLAVSGVEFETRLKHAQKRVRAHILSVESTPSCGILTPAFRMSVAEETTRDAGHHIWSPD